MMISEHSVFVRTDHRLAIGEPVRVRLSFPGLVETLELEATVASRTLDSGPGEPAGLTLAFALRDGEHDALRALLGRVDPQGEPQEGTAPYHVVLIDDSQMVRELFTLSLARYFRDGSARMSLSVAPSAEVGWSILQAEPCHLVIVDHFLPGIGGAELVERLRNDSRLSRLPIVAISMGGSAAYEKMIAAGADVFLDKPIAVSDLFDTLDTLTAGRVQCDA